jgi:hypothetical protein
MEMEVEEIEEGVTTAVPAVIFTNVDEREPLICNVPSL